MRHCAPSLGSGWGSLNAYHVIITPQCLSSESEGGLVEPMLKQSSSFKNNCGFLSFQTIGNPVKRFQGKIVVFITNTGSYLHFMTLMEGLTAQCF